MRHSVTIVLLAVALMMGCKPGVPKDVIQPDEMEAILYDYHVASAMARETGGKSDYKRSTYLLAALKKHNISEAEFDSSLVYYYTRADRLREIYAHVSDRLSMEAKAMGADVAEADVYASKTGDTANVWRGDKHAILVAHEALNRFDFHLDADTSYRRGDSFLFQFRSEYIWQTGAKDAVVCLVMHYDGDSITQTTNHITVSGLSQMRPPLNRDGLLRSVDGFIYLNVDPQDGDARRLMFVNQIQLIRFHNKKADDTTKADSLKSDSLKASVLRADSLAQDSLRRAANRGAVAADSASSRDKQRKSGQPVPFNPRATGNRVDKRQAEH